MRLFICGPLLDGNGQINHPAFFAAEEVLRGRGYDTANPARLQDKHGFDVGDASAALQLLLGCDGVALLPGWGGDRDAHLYRKAGQRCNMPIQQLDNWPVHGPALPHPPEVAVQRTGIANDGRALHTAPAPEYDYGTHLPDGGEGWQ